MFKLGVLKQVTLVSEDTQIVINAVPRVPMSRSPQHPPFQVSLKYAFESKNDLFLILDLMTGGEPLENCGVGIVENIQTVLLSIQEDKYYVDTRWT